MAGFLVAVAEAIQGLQCRLLDGNEGFVDSVGRFSGPVRRRALDGINATRRLLGCDQAEDPEDPPPPFTGGQCDCSRYEVNVQTQYDTVTGTGNTVTVNAGVIARVRGPITGITATFQPRPGFATGRIAYNFASRGAQPSTTPACQPPDIYTVVPGNASPRPEDPIRIVSITTTPLGGDLDDCGDPEPVFGPPTPRPIDIDITFEPDVGPEITVPITFNFNPVEINLNGTFRIPFDFSFGGFNFTGNVNFNPTAEITINPPSANPGDGTDLDDQGDDEPGETVPPRPPDQKIVGIVVTATDVGIGRVSQISNVGMPPTFAPRLGSVKFAYSLGGATFFSSDIDIKDRRTFIECPFSQGADAAIASPQPGVALSFTEIRGFPLATTADVNRPT